MHPLNIAVDEYVTPSPVTVEPSTPVTSVVALMNEYDIRHMPVVEGTRPVGIISHRDIAVLANIRGIDDIVSGDIMIPDPFTVLGGTPLAKVVFHLSERKIGSAIVVTPEGAIDGIFTLTDALNALIEILHGDLPEGAEIIGDAVRGEATVLL